jgi:hypothetical protein
MKRLIGTVVLAVALAGMAGTAGAADDNAGCVGQFSSFFAQGGLETHRSELAQDFAKNAQPAGQNVYSHVAEFHGTLEECFAQT